MSSSFRIWIFPFQTDDERRGARRTTRLASAAASCRRRVRPLGEALSQKLIGTGSPERLNVIVKLCGMGDRAPAVSTDMKPCESSFTLSSRL